MKVFSIELINVRTVRCAVLRQKVVVGNERRLRLEKENVESF